MATIIRHEDLRTTALLFVGSPERYTRASYSGAVAQLGERLVCIQEVEGSIPFGSTTVKHRRNQKLDYLPAVGSAA